MRIRPNITFWGGTDVLVLGMCLACCALAFPAENSGRVPAAQRQGEGKKALPFWQEKGITEWSPQEVLLFLQDSPWAKTERISIPVRNAADPLALQSPSVAGAPRMMKIETCCRTFEVPVAGSNSESVIDPPGAGRPDISTGSSRTWIFSARLFWISSVSIRRALIRQRQLAGIPAQLSEAALAPSSELVLALSGSFLKLLESLPPDEVRTISLLRSARGTKRRLASTEYIPAQPDGDSMAFLIFPKTVEGKPVYSLEDGPVVFSMTGTDFKLESQFALEPMMVDGKLDW